MTPNSQLSLIRGGFRYMSDNWIVFIPENPTAQPTSDAARRARELLKAILPDAEFISSKFVDRTEFVDPGGNWSGVRCPACSAEADGWWSDAMSAAAKQNFSELKVVTPCCGTETSLHELSYIWPAGFAKFWIEAMNPNVSNTTEIQDRELEKCLGMPLRKILRHI
jgi:hypothetical protein